MCVLSRDQWFVAVSIICLALLAVWEHVIGPLLDRIYLDARR